MFALYKSYNLLCGRTSTKSQLQYKQSLVAQQRLMCAHVKYTIAFGGWILPVFFHISPFEFGRGVQGYILVFVLYITASSSRLQYCEDDGRGCVRAAHVIPCCQGSTSPWWMTYGGGGWTSTVRHDMRGDLIGGDRTASAWIENADGGSRSTSSSILPCSQMKSLWTAVSKDSNSLQRQGLN